MSNAEEKYDKERGLYYDHTTIYKKKEKPDTRGATRRRIEDLEGCGARVWIETESEVICLARD